MREINRENLKLGIEEIFKMGLNDAEIKLGQEVEILKSNKDMLAGTMDKLDEKYEGELRRLGLKTYLSKIDNIQNYLDHQEKIKYSIELNRIIQSKINEVKNYQGKR